MSLKCYTYDEQEMTLQNRNRVETTEKIPAG